MTRRIFLFLITTALFLSGHYVLAQTVDDFKEAVSNKGCESIPYRDLRDRCSDKQQYVHGSESCDGQRSCKTLGREVKRQQNLLAIALTNCDALKQSKADLENEKSDVGSDDEELKSQLERKIDQIQAQIDQQQKYIDDLKANIETNRTSVNERIGRGEKCQDARRQVQDVFKDATSKAKDESDDQIKPLAGQLVDKWEESGRSHEEELGGVITVLNLCKDLR